MRGRQIAFMIYDFFRVTGAHHTVLDYAVLFSVTLHDDNIQEFDTRWDEVWLIMSKIPSDEILESLYKLRIRESVQLKTVLELYDMEIHQKISMPNYQKLKTVVKRSIDQKLRLRNFDARHGRIETGAVVKSRKGLSGVEGGKGTCHQWKEKGQCSKGDRCSVRHVSNDRAQKPEHKAATPSEPSMSRGRSLSKKRRIQGKSNHGAILRHTCRYFLKGACTRSPCECWHPPECQFYKTETGCKAGDKCLFPHHKVDERPNKKPKKGYYSHRRRESDDKNAVAIVKIVTQLGCVSQDSEALVSQRGEQSPGNPMQKVSGPIRRKRITQSTLRQASIREKKGPSLGKIQVKNPHQRSPYIGPMKRLKDNSDAPEARHGTLPKTYISSKKGKAIFYSSAEEWVLPAASTKESGEREFVVDPGASMHMVSKKDLNYAELETMRTSRSSTTVMTANGEVQWRNSRSSFSREALRGSWVYLPLHQRSKITSHQKWQENWLQYIKLCATRCLVYRRVPLHHPHLLLRHLHHRILHLTSADTPKIQYPKEMEVRARSYGKTRCTNQQKPKIRNKKDAKKYKAIYYTNCRIGCWCSERIWSMNVVSQSHGEIQSLDIETLPILLMNYQWSREHKWAQVRVRIVSTRTFRRTQIAIPPWRRT